MKIGALARTRRDGYLAVMLPHDLEGNRKAQPRSVLFRGEVGLEDLGQVVFRNAHAAILDRNPQLLVHAIDGKAQLAAAGHGGEGVLHEIEHGLLHEAIVERDPRQIVPEPELDHDACPLRLGFDEFGYLGDELAGIGLPELDVHGTDREEEIDDDLVEPIDLLVHHLEVALDQGNLDLSLPREGLPDELYVNRKGAQGVLYLVGDAGGEGSQGGEALRPAQLGLLAPLFRDVLHVDDSALYAALRDEGAHRHRDEPRRALGLQAELAVEHRLFPFEGLAEEVREVLVRDTVPKRSLEGIGTGEPEHALGRLVVDDRQVIPVADDDAVEHGIEGGVHAAVLLGQGVEEGSHLIRVEPRKLGQGPFDEAPHGDRPSDRAYSSDSASKPGLRLRVS